MYVNTYVNREVGRGLFLDFHERMDRVEEIRKRIYGGRGTMEGSSEINPDFGKEVVETNIKKGYRVYGRTLYQKQNA